MAGVSPVWLRRCGLYQPAKAGMMWLSPGVGLNTGRDDTPAGDAAWVSVTSVTIA